MWAVCGSRMVMVIVMVISCGRGSGDKTECDECTEGKYADKTDIEILKVDTEALLTRALKTRRRYGSVAEERIPVQLYVCARAQPVVLNVIACYKISKNK